MPQYGKDAAVQACALDTERVYGNRFEQFRHNQGAYSAKDLSKLNEVQRYSAHIDKNMLAIYEYIYIGEFSQFKKS